MKDDFGERMKLYENQESGRRLVPLLPIIARLDGKAFHSFTEYMKRPFDGKLSELMMLTTEFLVKETNASIGYTQSDEISLTWHSQSYDQQLFFDGRIQKMVSVLASMTTGFFNRNFTNFFNERELAFFDCRVFNVPNIEEGANVVPTL